MSEWISTLRQTLIFNAQILEDERYLSSYEVKNESIIYLTVLSAPKMAKFVEIFDGDIPPRAQLSDEGEKWRCVEPGVCFEGFCLNGKCEACYQMVIHNFGFGFCDLHCKEVACPLCKYPFEVSYCAVNNCFVRVVAVAKTDKAVKRLKGEWFYAKNEYLSFDRSKLINSSYSSVFLEVCLSRGDLVRELDCAICLDTLVEHQKQPMKCGHKCHKSCLADWKAKKQTCLVCSANIPSMLTTLELAI